MQINVRDLDGCYHTNWGRSRAINRKTSVTLNITHFDEARSVATYHVERQLIDALALVTKVLPC